jgi:cyclohexanecarboxylate-CoA ligase
VRQVQESLRVPLRAAAPAGSAADGRTRGRGPASPLAVWRRESGGLRPTWEQDGQGRAGDLADAGDAGTGSTPPYAEEIGGVFLVPVGEVEEQLLAHPRIAEAAVIACTDPDHGELACAVVVPAGDPPTLTEVRGHLLDRGTFPAHLPARLELVGALPRTSSGEIRRGELRLTLSRRLVPRAP